MHTSVDNRADLECISHYISTKRYFLESGSIKCGENVNLRPHKCILLFLIARYCRKSGFEGKFTTHGCQNDECHCLNQQFLHFQ